MINRKMIIKGRKIKIRGGVKGYKRRESPEYRKRMRLTRKQKIKKFINTIRAKRRIKRESEEKVFNDEVEYKKGICHNCKKEIDIPLELYSEKPEEQHCFECMEEEF